MKTNMFAIVAVLAALAGCVSANCDDAGEYGVTVLGHGQGAAEAHEFLVKHQVPIGHGPLEVIFGDTVDELDDVTLTNRLTVGGALVNPEAVKRIKARGFGKLVTAGPIDTLVPDPRVLCRQAKRGWVVILTENDCRSDVLIPHLELAAASSLKPFATDLTREADAKLPPALCPKPQCEGPYCWWYQCFLYKRGESAWVKDRAKLVFLGDSITCMFGGPVWDENFGSGEDYAVNCGISGDRTENLIYRLRNGALENFCPETAVLLIGTNNGCRKDEPPEVTAAAIKECIRLIRLRNPNCRVILNAIFPCGRKADDPSRARVKKVNDIIRSFADGKSVIWLDMEKDFLEPDGTLPKKLFPDALHPSPDGYRLWAKRLKAILH